MLSRARSLGILLLVLMACRNDAGQERSSSQPEKQTQLPHHQEETVTQTPQLVALVWMRSEAGDRGATHEAPADARQTDTIAAYFRELGFEVTEPQSGQFSITGPQDLFESTFGEKVELQIEGGEIRRVSGGEGDLVLNLQRLPEEVQNGIHVVTFEEPIEFGPPSY